MNGGRSFCLPRSAPIRGKECVFQAPFLSSQRKAEKANSAIQAASPQIPTTNLSHFSNAMMRKLSGMSLMSKSSLFSLGAPSPQYRDRSRRPPKANASPVIDTYVLQSTSDENDFKEIMKLLNSARYRQDFRNLLPWSITTVGSESNCSANIMLVWGDTATERCFISFQSESIVSVAAGTEGDFQIYHPTDRTVLGRLIDYVQLHGEQN